MLELYKNIRLRREALGLSQAELARMVGYNDRSSIAKIEAGKVDLSQSKIMEFADALRVSAGDLMGLDGVTDSNQDSVNEKEKEILTVLENDTELRLLMHKAIQRDYRKKLLYWVSLMESYEKERE